MEQVSRRHWILAVSLVLAVTAGAAAMLRQPPPVPVQTHQVQAAPQPMPEPATAEVPPYRIAVWQGRVAIFEGAEPLPATVLETSAASLPEADQRALEEGIPVYSREELAGLMEDYGS